MRKTDLLEKREKAKKFWLIYFTASTAFSSYALIMDQLMQIKFGMNPLPWNWMVGLMGWSLFSTALAGFIVYYCAYARPGTKFLKFSIGSALLVLPAILFYSPKAFAPKWLAIESSIDWGIAGVHIGLVLLSSAVGVYANWKLHNANMQCKKSLKLA